MKKIPAIALTASLAFGGSACSAKTSPANAKLSPNQPSQEVLKDQNTEADAMWAEGMTVFKDNLKKGNAEVEYDKGNCLAFEAPEGYVLLKNPALYKFRKGSATIEFLIYGKVLDKNTSVIFNGPYEFTPDDPALPGISMFDQVNIMKGATNFVKTKLHTINSDGKTEWLSQGNSTDGTRISETLILSGDAMDRLGEESLAFCGVAIDQVPQSSDPGPQINQV